MKNLLENDLPEFYGVGRRCICDENTTSLSEFDLTEDDTQFVVGYKKGYASFCGNPFNLSVVNYDTYIGRYTGTKISDGKRRCDFILTDTDTNNIILLCEVTSSIGGMENLSRPIEKTQKDGTRTVVFPKGKYQKVELQFYQSLETLTEVPSISSYINKKKRKVCLMSYLIKRTENNAINAFNRNRLMEAEETGENGAQISCPQIEQFGFDYYRISHDYSFKIDNNLYTFISTRVAALSAERYCGGELHFDFIFITTCCMGFDAHTAAYCIPLYSSEDFLLCKTTDWYLLSLPHGRVLIL